MPIRLPDQFWSSAALFLLPALSLIAPSGYSYGPALLIITTMICIRLWWQKSKLSNDAKWIFVSFALLAACWLVDNWISGERGAAIEKPIKILMTFPCMLYLTQRPPKALWLWNGVVIGAIGAASISIYQAWTAFDALRGGWFRATGFIHPIQFGNFAVLLGILSLCAWNAATSKLLKWRIWLTIGFIASLIASLLSGSRGSWLTLAIIGVIAAIYLLSKGHWRIIVPIMTLGIITAGVISEIPQLRLQERIALITKEITSYHREGNATTSVGARLQMWNFAWELYREKPLLGWSQKGYIEEKNKRIAEHRMDPTLGDFNHPHNEILDAASKRGTVGIFILLFAYLAPMWIFGKNLSKAINPTAVALSAAGLSIPITYIGFGLTEAFMPHTSAVTVYVYLCSLILATLEGISPKNQSYHANVPHGDFYTISNRIPSKRLLTKASFFDQDAT